MHVCAIVWALRPLHVLEEPRLFVAHVEAAADEEVAAFAADERQRDLRARELPLERRNASPP